MHDVFEKLSPGLFPPSPKNPNSEVLIREELDLPTNNILGSKTDLKAKKTQPNPPPNPQTKQI